jgi:alcohol dehydrogenase class IV
MTAPLMRNQWNYPTHVHFGLNEINQLNNHIKALACTKPLLICDEFLLTQPIIQTILNEIQQSNTNLTLFSDFKGNPTHHHVLNAIELAHQANNDCVIGLGGGSAIDIAKIVAVGSRCKADLWDFIDDNSPRPSLEHNQALPIIAIPTTAGTGSEVSRASLVTHAQNRTKHILFHPQMLPSRVICDPQLTLTLPPKLTAWTGFDALAHNLEALCSPQFHPQAEGIAMEGIRLISESLITACTNGENLHARSNMMCASLMGATAFQKGLGAIHSLSHPVGGLFDAHHGLLNAIFMPTVLRYNQSYITDKMTRLARYLNLPNPGVDTILQWVDSLLKESKTPSTLSEININDKHASLIGELAFADPSTSSNPRPLSVNDCEALFKSALHGDYSLIPKVETIS